jgi:hypothetical protein
MHLRRALLLLGLVLLVVAAVESLVPVPRERPAVQPPSAPAPAAAAPVRAIVFQYPQPARERTVAVAVGTHAIVRVPSAEPGQVTLAGLGRDASVEPGTPASFDLLATRAGRYDVLFRPVSGLTVRVGRLLVR